MERLTEKAEIGYREKDNDYSIKVSIQKLGRLEDIEQELGIPLEVLFKALKDGVVFKRRHNGEICKCSAMLYLFNKTWYIDGEVRFCEAKLKDYGKTWWLEKPKEELENDI